MRMVCSVSKSMKCLCPLTLANGPIKNYANNKQFLFALCSLRKRAQEQHAMGYSICYFYACDVKAFNRTLALFTIQTNSPGDSLSLTLSLLLCLSPAYLP